MERKTPQTARVPAGRTPHDLNRALTGTAWLPNEELRLSDWVEHGRRLGVIGRCVGWWIGDWLRYGNMKFGQRYVRASRITGYDVQTLMNMVYVASAYAPAERRGNLSFSHHAEIAALPPDERERWLDLAETNRMSVRCLREEVRRARRLAAGEELAGEPVAELSAGDATEVEPVTAGDAHPVRCPQCGCEIAGAAPVALPRRAGAGIGERGAA